MAFIGSSSLANYGGAYNVVQPYSNQYNTTNLHNFDSFSDEVTCLELLASQAAMNACRDSEMRFPAPNCHRNTRVEALSTLGLWSGRAGTTRVYWVHGSAGVGKSAIAQKLSEDHANRVAGTFFFSRNDATRNKIDPLVATIAYQCCIAEHFKDTVRPVILQVIRSNPKIFHSTSKVQFQKLLLEPFSRFTQQLPNLIVIDGLDECVDSNSQQRILEIIDLAITFHTSVPFIFLLCSRPEPQICYGVNNAVFARCLERMEISGTTIRLTGEMSDSDLDIQRYFIDKFAEIQRKHWGVFCEEEGMWPSYRDIENLVWRASGQFIFAVTVISYIDTLDELPQDRLRHILDMQPSGLQDSPYPALDALYRQILSTCLHWDRVRSILRLLITPHPLHFTSGILWCSPSIIAQMFEIKLGEVKILLSRLHSVLHIPEGILVHRAEIHILHASFMEFLLDSARSGPYFITPYSTAEYCDRVAVLLLRRLSAYRTLHPLYSGSKTGQFDTALAVWRDNIRQMNLDSMLDTSIWLWPSYCQKVHSPTANLIAALNTFDPYLIGSMTLSSSWVPALVFLKWANCLAWAKSLQEGIPKTFIEGLEAFFCGCYIGFSRMTSRHDAVRGTYNLECGIGTPENNQDDTVALILKYHRWWWGRKKQCHPSKLQDYGCPLLLPTTSDLAKLSLKEWVIIHVTGASGNMLKEMYVTRKSLDEDTQELFDNDIIYGTSDITESGKLEKEDNLKAFKLLMYKRLDTFACLNLT